MDIGLLISGKLGLIVFKELLCKHIITFVLTDKKSDSIIEYCKIYSIPFFSGNPRNKSVMKVLDFPACDIIVSVNYLFIVSSDIFKYPKRMSINFHGSLLPKYRGRTPHVWAIINNEHETGITAHLIDENCDTGDIIAQIKIPIEKSYTGNDVLTIFNTLYPQFVYEVIMSIEKNTVLYRKQDDEKATFFGKRVAENGQINWNWQKERIYNWVRAQAKPYPGSFSLINNLKCIIHKIEFSTLGYTNDVVNGEVIGFEDRLPIIKSSNGCIKILEYEYTLCIKLNDILK